MSYTSSSPKIKHKKLHPQAFFILFVASSKDPPQLQSSTWGSVTVVAAAACHFIVPRERAWGSTSWPGSRESDLRKLKLDGQRGRGVTPQRAGGSAQGAATQGSNSEWRGHEAIACSRNGRRVRVGFASWFVLCLDWGHGEDDMDYGRRGTHKLWLEPNSELKNRNRTRRAHYVFLMQWSVINSWKNQNILTPKIWTE